jgi:hypothetical protein
MKLHERDRDGMKEALVLGSWFLLREDRENAVNAEHS